MDNSLKENILRNIYYDPQNPGGYAGYTKLLVEARKIDPNITLKEVKLWLSKQLSYTLHKPALRKHKRNRIIVYGIDDQWECDLVDMKEFRQKNNYYTYLLTVIDVFSKYAWVQPLKNKGATTVANAMEKIFNEGRVPNRLRTDKGKEFINTEFKKIMKKYNIQHFTSNDVVIKCSVIERFNRTLKNKLFAFFTANSKQNYLKNLQDLVTAYNSSFHRSIKMRPIDVTENNEKVVFKNLFGFSTITELLQSKSKKSNDLQKGDIVRKQYDLKPFEKSYYPLWSDVVYEVKEKKQGTPEKQYFIHEPVSNKTLKQKPYRTQLQKVIPDKFRVESRPLKRRVRNGQIEYFVKFIGYPSSANAWITK